MAFEAKKENLDMLLNMCKKEYEISLRNVHYCQEKTEELYGTCINKLKKSDGSIAVCLESYDNTLKDLSHFADVLRKFNMQFEIDEFLRIKDKPHIVERFTYPHPDLSKYDNGYEAECVITYIKDAKNNLFYISEAGNSIYLDCLISMQNYFQDSPQEFIGIPECGEVFGLYLEGYMFRAVRENVQFIESNNFNVYLIDIGEVVQFDKNMDMYVLSPECQSIPAQAILCNLEKVKSNSFVNRSEFLTKNLYLKHKFHVNSKENLLLNVTLFWNTNPFKSGTSSSASSDSMQITRQKEIYQERSYQPDITLQIDDCSIHVELARNSVRNIKLNNSLPPITNPFKRYLCIKGNKRQDYSEDILDNCSSVTSNYVLDKQISIPENDEYESFTNENSPQHNLSDNVIFKNGYINNARNGKENNVHYENCYINISPESDLRNINSRAKNYQIISSSTPSQLEELYEEPLNTTNATKAVMGYEPKNGYINISPKNYQITSSSLTPSQLEELYEEPLNTTNAMKAVMGYEPKDDKRICRFYNPNINGCFKGALCKMEHVMPIKEGWTRDEALTHIDIRNKFQYPPIGSTISIIPTHVTNVEHFFTQLVITHDGRYEPSLKELIYKMNSAEFVQGYKKITYMPGKFELIIALYTDGLWYRGKVLDFIDDNVIKVFYLDYGNSGIIPLKNVRQWDSKFDYLPFQALSCKLAGVIPKRKCALEASEQLRRMILNRVLSAQVIDNVDQLCLKIKSADGQDVSSELISLGFVESKEFIITNYDQLLPA